VEERLWGASGGLVGSPRSRSIVSTAGAWVTKAMMRVSAAQN
jgi:hypothetical protein